MTRPAPRSTAAGEVRLLTRGEVAAIMRVTPRSVNNWAAQGILRPVRLPGRQRARGYLASDVGRILEARV